MTGPPVPDEHDPDAYRAGYAAAMAEIGRAALDGAAAVDGDGDEDDDTCPECGAVLLTDVTAAETTTPPGYTCPECEL